MIAEGDAALIAAHHTQDVLEGFWVVGAAAAAGSTSFSVVYHTPYPPGRPPIIGASDAANFQGARLVFWSGQNQGFSTTVQSVATDLSVSPPVTTITIKDPLPAAVQPGSAGPPPVEPDGFTIYRALAIEVTAPENIAQVGGVAVPTDFAGNPAVPITHFDQLVQNGTIGSTQTGFVASGDEVAYLTLTVNGVFRVNGGLFVSNLVVGDGGSLLLADQGLIEAGAF